MLHRLEKIAVNTAHLVLLVLLVKTLCGYADWSVSLGFAALSGFWLLLTSLTFRRLLVTYFDRVSWAQVVVPLSTSTLLSLAAIVMAENRIVRTTASLEILGWALLYWRFKANRDNFVRVGHGPLPKDIWVNPPAEAIHPGDIIVMSGMISKLTHNSVGHMELVVERNGKRVAFSSYMPSGIVINSLRALLKVQIKGGGHYVVMRPKRAFSYTKNDLALSVIAQMHKVNQEWTVRTTAKRTAQVNFLLPQWLCNTPLIGRLVRPFKAWVLKKYLPTGYDWRGCYAGFIARDRWTCMGACLRVLRTIGVKTKHYGTGIMGLGTGLLNPLQPARFLSEPNFRYLDKEDQWSYEY